MEKVQRTIKQNFTTAYYHYNDRDTQIEQSSGGDKILSHTCFWDWNNEQKLGTFEQNIEKNGSKKKELLERKIGGKKS